MWGGEEGGLDGVGAEGVGTEGEGTEGVGTEGGGTEGMCVDSRRNPEPPSRKTPFAQAPDVSVRACRAPPAHSRVPEVGSCYGSAD